MRILIYITAIAVIGIGFYLFYWKNNPFGKDNYESFLERRNGSAENDLKSNDKKLE